MGQPSRGPPPLVLHLIGPLWNWPLNRGHFQTAAHLLHQLQPHPLYPSCQLIACHDRDTSGHTDMGLHNPSSQLARRKLQHHLSKTLPLHPLQLVLSSSLFVGTVGGRLRFRKFLLLGAWLSRWSCCLLYCYFLPLCLDIIDFFGERQGTCGPALRA